MMDSFTDNNISGVDEDAVALSYDDTVPYDAQVAPTPSLANRIGNTRVYLLSESSVAGKRKRRDEEEEEADGGSHDIVMQDDLARRPNALLLQGSPISHLPTARLFAYATHFDAQPMGLEWVDDTTCVLVFSTDSAARAAHRQLQKTSPVLSIDSDFAADMLLEDDEEGFVVAKPIPVSLWPPEDRISKTLGMGEGLKGEIRMRWARGGDVKKRGAKRESEFYKKHGENAGKNLSVPYADDIREQPHAKRRRGRDELEAEQRARLDDEMDAFLAEDGRKDTDEEVLSEIVDPPSPPSKMRSDYIGPDGRAPDSDILSDLVDGRGRTLLERTRLNGKSDVLASRMGPPSPPPRRRPRGGQGRTRKRERSDIPKRSGERPRKSQQELDDELEAFLNDRS